MRRLLLVASALALNSCADAIAAPVNGECSLEYTQYTPYPFWFPDGSSVDAVPVTAKLTTATCPAPLGADTYQATVHGHRITYRVTWPSR